MRKILFVETCELFAFSRENQTKFKHELFQQKYTKCFTDFDTVYLVNTFIVV